MVLRAVGKVGANFDPTDFRGDGWMSRLLMNDGNVVREGWVL